jgi:hypothetical protein
MNFRFASAAYNADILINEVRVPSIGLTPSTYYETLGWWGTAAGYAGIQCASTQTTGKPFIFSIWDNPAQTGPLTSADVGYGTAISTFGGEGTGLKSMNHALGWKTDLWYVTAVRAWPVGNRTCFGYFVRDGETKKWRHLVTMNVAASNVRMIGDIDGFIEDWSSTGANRRETNMRKAWKYAGGKWYPGTSAYYSVNGGDIASGGRSYNYRTNWDAGVKTDSTGSYYYMVAGGASTVPSCKNGATFTIARTGETAPDYPAFTVAFLGATVLGTNLVVAWDRDSTTLPQFTCTLEIFNDTTCSGTPLVTVSKTELRRSSDTLSLSSLTPAARSYALRMSVVDIFANKAALKIVPFGAGVGTIPAYGNSGCRASDIRINAQGSLVFSAPRNGVYSVSLSALNGREIMKTKLSLKAGAHSVSVPAFCSAGGCIARISEHGAHPWSRETVVFRE